MGRKVKEFKCNCGETDPNKFYGACKSWCKKCYGEKIKSRPYYNSNKNKRQALDWYEKNTIRSRWLQAKYRAKQKGMEFSLTEHDIENLIIEQNNKCYYSGIEFKLGDPRWTLSLDRIDSDLGYTKQNVRLLCAEINYMKSDLAEWEFLEIIKKIYNNIL